MMVGMLTIILGLVLLGLVVAAVQALMKAPAEQKAMIGGVLAVLAVVGAGVGFFLAASPEERTFYPVAGAIGGTMVSFIWISQKQKGWPKKS